MVADLAARPPSRLPAWTTLLRVRTCLCGSAALAVGAVAARSDGLRVRRLVPGAVAAFLAVAHCNVLNDIVDRRADAVDQPWRPLPSGALTSGAAAVAYVAACLGSVAAGRAAGPPVDAWAGALIPLSALYSLYLKGTALYGNVLVAAMGASPLIVGAALAGAPEPDVVVQAVVLAVALVGFEVTKTARDHQGDRAVGLRTIAVRHPPATAVAIGVGFVRASAVLAAAACLMSRKGLVFGVLFELLVCAPILGRYRKIRSSSSPDRPDGTSEMLQVMKKAWKFAVLALVLSAVAG